MFSKQSLKKFFVTTFTIFSIFLFFYFCIVPVASAHEVYVLSPTEVHEAIQEPSVSPLSVIQENMSQFLLAAFVVLFLIIVILFTSISRRLEKFCDPFLIRLKPYAPLVGRVTMGLSFIAAAYYGASFGPEIPTMSLYGSYAPIVIALMYAVGILVILGLWVRVAAMIAFGMFAVAVYFKGVYMVTYINYLGEIILLLLAGAGSFALQKSTIAHATHKKIEQYGFLISRILFGTALIFASSYAKLIHSNLGLDTVLKFHLTNYFPFEPHFLVLGAGLIEIMIGVFFILGIEIRFTAIFLNMFLIMSLLFFGEVVWPHIILIGIPIALFCYGYDQYSLEGYFFKRRGREPVL